MKKVLAFIAITALLIAVMLPLGAAAFAEETTETVATATETTIIDEEASLDSFFNRYIVPIVGGSAASALGIGLAIAIPFIRKSSAYKSLSVGYSSLKRQAEEWKKQAESTDVNAIIKQVTAAVSTAAIDKIGEIVKQEMDKRVDQTNQIFTNTEIMSAQLANFLSAANIVWGPNVDGVSELLAKSPTTALLHQLEDYNLALKNIIIEKLGVTNEDLNKMLEV